MGEIVTVRDPRDPRLADFTSLTDVELRRRREPAEGLFIAEGEKVIRRAVRAGYPMRAMLLTTKWMDALRDVIDEVDAPVHVVPPETAEAVTGYHVHRGALASMGRTAPPRVEDLLTSAHRIVVMEAVNDHTNIGAIFRSAAALGMDAVLLSASCADPLYRRSVKVSMGAVFSVPYAYLAPWPQELETVHNAGFALLALTPDSRAVPIDTAASARRTQRPAVMLGAEGTGLSPRALRAADAWVRIPMAGTVDSLNVGAAAAVAFHTLSGRRDEG